MNGMFLAVIALVVVVIVIAVVAAAGNKSGSANVEGTRKVRELNIDAVDKQKKPEPEDPEVTEAKNELYQYLNQGVRRMFQQYRKGNWDTIIKIGVPSDKVLKHYDKIEESLPTQAAQILKDYFTCIDLKGDEETAPGTVIDKERLKEVFLEMVLPFYPVYYDKLDGVRYTSLLNQTMLNLFHRLTGRKFRLGYKNRYKTGVTAYRWEGNRYQVFSDEGQMLCDAVFRDGRVWEGYAVLPLGEQERDWEVLQEGTFKEGVFVDGTLHYIYEKTIG